MRTKTRPVTVSSSISLEPEKFDALTSKAFEKGYSSRNNLIYHILTEWLEKENKKNKV